MNLEQEKLSKIKGRRKTITKPKSENWGLAPGWSVCLAVTNTVFALQCWKWAEHLATVGPLQPAECADLRFLKDVPAEQRRNRNKIHEEIVAKKSQSWMKVHRFKRHHKP